MSKNIYTIINITGRDSQHLNATFQMRHGSRQINVQKDITSLVRERYYRRITFPKEKHDGREIYFNFR